MKKLLILICTALLSISSSILGCGSEEDIDLTDSTNDVANDVSNNIDDTVDTDSASDSVDTIASVPPSGTSTAFFIPDNCDNPPTQISSNDGFQCIASRTRNDSIVCLLPFQFTWSPLVTFRDDAGFTFGCNANDDFFDEVRIFLTSGEEIRLVESGCFNFVATADGPIGRQHWRNEGVQFSSVESRLDLMVMTRNGQDTCLRF